MVVKNRQFRLGRSAAEALLKDFEASGYCKEEVAAIIAVAGRVLSGGVVKQTTLPSFFQKP